MLKKNLLLVIVILVIVIILSNIGWSTYNSKLLRKQKNELHEQNQKNLDSLFYTIDSLQLKIDIRTKQIDSIEKSKEVVKTKIVYIEKQKQELKNSTDSLPDSSLVKSILKDYPLSLSNYKNIQLPRPVVGWLYESTKELELLTIQYEYMKDLYNKSERQNEEYRGIIQEQDIQKLMYTSVLTLKENEVDYWESAYLYERNAKRKITWIAVGEAVLIMVFTYSALK